MKYYFIVFLILLNFGCKSITKLSKTKDNKSFLTTGFPKEITRQMPLTELPNKKIPVESVFFTTRFDTVKVYKIFDSIQDPKAYIFIEDLNSNDQFLAVKRNTDWVIIHHGIFKQAALLGYEMEWMNFRNHGPMLLFTLDHQANVSEKIGGSSGYVENQSKSYSMHWKRAKGYCLLDIENLCFVLDNIYSGYEYSYKQWENFREPIPNDRYNNFYYGKRKFIEYNQNLWYEILFNQYKEEIVIKKTYYKNVIKSDESITYSSKKINTEKGKISNEEIKTFKKLPCKDILFEGVYILRGDKFVLEN